MSVGVYLDRKERITGSDILSLSDERPLFELQGADEDYILDAGMFVWFRSPEVSSGASVVFRVYNIRPVWGDVLMDVYRVRFEDEVKFVRIPSTLLPADSSVRVTATLEGKDVPVEVYFYAIRQVFRVI